MKKAVPASRANLLLLSILLILVASPLLAQSPKNRGDGASSAAAVPVTPASEAKKVEFMPVSELRRGMKGVAYTVFQGIQPETMEVEILGVLKNALGPKSDLILAQLHGPRVEHTGVAAGMSGSPVYIDGKLVGAISFRIGAFSKEPIAGITPIAEMLEINALDSTIPIRSTFSSSPGTTTTQTAAGATENADPPSYAQSITPIAAPLVFNGFSEDAVKQFAPQFIAAGIIPVMGVGGSSEEPQPEPLVPGSMVSAVLIRGDMNAAAGCTVTYVDHDRLLACGHPIQQSGMVEMPMNKGQVITTLASPLNAIKIMTTTENAGMFLQDRHTGIMGRFDRQAQMIPVNLTIHGGPEPRSFHYEVMNSPRLTPLLMMATVYNALQGLNAHDEETTYRMQGSIQLAGHTAVGLQNMFAPTDTMPTAISIALSVGERFGRIYDNVYQKPSVSSVNLDFDGVRERRSARLESARTDVTEARPGEEIVIEAVLRPYRGEPMVRLIPVKIPTSTPKGTLRILVSDGETLDRTRRMNSGFARKLDLDTTIALLNKEHLNHRLYVSLLEANPQAMVEDKVMPSLPLSVMNVMDGMRGTQEMVVTGESSVGESSTPLDYVVTGSQVISLTIK